LPWLKSQTASASGQRVFFNRERRSSRTSLGTLMEKGSTAAVIKTSVITGLNDRSDHRRRAPRDIGAEARSAAVSLILNSLPKPSTPPEIWWDRSRCQAMLWLLVITGMSRARSSCVMIAADLMAVQLRKQTSAERRLFFLAHSRMSCGGRVAISVLVLMPRLAPPSTTKPFV